MYHVLFAWNAFFPSVALFFAFLLFNIYLGSPDWLLVFPCMPYLCGHTVLQWLVFLLGAHIYFVCRLYYCHLCASSVQISLSSAQCLHKNYFLNK